MGPAMPPTPPPPESCRLYSCTRCGALARICRPCDRGNIYCTACQPEARRERVRRAGRRYQASQRGRERHAQRQREYRARRASERAAVTHRGPSELPPGGPVGDEVASSDTRCAGAEASSLAKVPTTGSSKPAGAPTRPIPPAAGPTSPIGALGSRPSPTSRPSLGGRLKASDGLFGLPVTDGARGPAPSRVARDSDAPLTDSGTAFPRAGCARCGCKLPRLSRRHSLSELARRARHLGRHRLRR